MRVAVAAWVFVLTIAACGDASAQYFIEFRARDSDYIGHTYITYFRTDPRGRVVEAHESGLIPEENVWNGLFSPIRARVRSYEDDVRMPVTQVYRKRLSAEEYARVGRAVRMLKANQNRWHVIFYNCNDFAIEVAESLGLRRPPSLLPPSVWVGSLRLLNGP